jgi:flavorubredoxin
MKVKNCPKILYVLCVNTPHQILKDYRREKMYTKVTNTIYYIGVNDHDIDLFEGQYVVPNGMAYNSYVIKDEKIAVMDTVDIRKADEWLTNLDEVLEGKSPDYLVVTHLEPDHAGSIKVFCDTYPETTLVMTMKAKAMLPQFFGNNIKNPCRGVVEAETLTLGAHTLTFVTAPMVHWPEVMVAYDSHDKVLFAADAFGKFGALDVREDWTCEARRYYFNIVGKYGAQVQALLKKASSLDIQIICPLHGPMLSENLGFYLDKYNTWSSYMPEDDGILIAVASIYGNTMKAAKKLAEILTDAGAKKVVVTDLARDDSAEALEDAFRYDKVVFAASSYDAGVFPFMEEFLHHLKAKNYQKRKVALVENGSWGPTAAKTMRGILEQMKDIEIIEPVVTIKSTMSEENIEEFKVLAKNLLN